MSVQIIQGDALEVLKTLPSESVQCCVTSPPYWGLRDYGVAGQFGLEETPEEYVAKMVEVFAEVRRVLREDGTCWINLGDSYANDGKWGGKTGGKQAYLNDSNRKRVGREKRLTGLKPKDLCGIPWRVAFALQADGWWLRQDIIWHKPNPMPESVTDRCTKAHEYIFLLTKSERYFYDAEAVKEQLAGEPHAPGNKMHSDKVSGPNDRNGHSQWETSMDKVWGESGTRNKRSVWTIPSNPYSEAHFATFPPDLIKPCILAGTSARGCCPKCGAPWQRVVEIDDPNGRLGKGYHDHKDDLAVGQRGVFPADGAPTKRTTGWKQTCQCGESKSVPCTILDPFGGSGTTGMVALELGRKAILIELNPEYVKLAHQRCDVTPGLALA